MRTAAVAFILSMLCAALLTPIVRRLARRFGALDHALVVAQDPRPGGSPPGRHRHRHRVLCAAAGPAVHPERRRRVAGPRAALRARSLPGRASHRRPRRLRRPARRRRAEEVRRSVPGRRDRSISSGFGSTPSPTRSATPIALGWAALPFTLLWVVGVINAMNLIDGLDGLAGGVALVAVTHHLPGVAAARPAADDPVLGVAGRRDPRFPVLQLQPGVDLHGRHRAACSWASCWRPARSEPIRSRRPRWRC